MRALRRTCIVISLSATIALTGCSSNPGRTHDPDLLDDKVTTQRVSAALTRGGPDFRTIEVETTKGVVVLSGTVRSQEVRERAEAIVRSAGSVAKLEDRLEIQR